MAAPFAIHQGMVTGLIKHQYVASHGLIGFWF